VSAAAFSVGAVVLGAKESPRALVPHHELLTSYADGTMAERGAEGEAYLSHYAFGDELRRHHAANRNSVAGFTGPCGCRWLILDIDRTDPAAALADTRKLVAFLHRRYPEAEGAVPLWFSGRKGYHVAVELAHEPPPAVGFPLVARAFAEQLARSAGVVIDTSIYNISHIIRLPNTRHPGTGLFKRLIDADALFRLGVDGIRRHAAHPAGDGIPVVRTVPAELPADWHSAEQATVTAVAARVAIRGPIAHVADDRAPRYFVEFLRFGVDEGERHCTLFRCAAWLTEQGAPPTLAFALLSEPGEDIGLTPKDVARQIRCGIDHAVKQRAVTNPRPDPADPKEFGAWAIRQEGDPLPPGNLAFPFGENGGVA